MDKNKCTSCGKPKCSCKNKDFTKAVIEIDNPEQITLMRKVVIPASMGDDTTVPPVVGKYHNVLLYYEANSKSYLYSSDGIPTQLNNGITNYEDAINLPQINGVTLRGNKTSEELGLQDEIANIEQYARFFDTVADMKASGDLNAGDYARTGGFYALNDGGGALYKITDAGTANEMDVIALNNNLASQLVYSNEINIKQLGAYGDNSHDDVISINRAIEIGKTVYIPNGTYLVSEVIGLPNNTTIIGEDWDNTIVAKTSSSTPDTVFNFVGSGEVALRNFTIECNSSVAYGILSTVTISKFELRNIRINRPATAGIYTDKTTYLGTISNVRVFNTSGYGFYLVPVDKNSYTNTSINFSNCYCSECTNAYRIDGSYMNMENCACDGAYHIAYDLRGYIGSLVSCGSEAYYCDYMFYGDNFTNATVVNAQTFASYDKENSVHIYTGNSSTWVFIGGKLAQKSHSSLDSGLGKFLEQSNDSHIKFIGTEIRGTFSQPSIIAEGIEVSDYKGDVFNKGDILYLGYNGTNFGDEIGSELLPSSAIYMGVSDRPYVIDSRRVISRGAHTGDIFITKTPSQVGGMGWISDTDISGNLSNGTYYKIPVVASGATGNEPTQGLSLGDMYYDTTLAIPKWLVNTGRQQVDSLRITTAPTSDGTITFTINGVNHDIPVTSGLNLAGLYSALISSDIEEVVFQLGSSSIICTSKIFKNYVGPMFSINTGSTGAVISDTVTTGGGTPQWKSLTDFVNP